MSLHTIARRYAKALLQVAVAQDRVERFYDELTQFSAALDASVTVRQLFADPGILIGTKRTIAKSLCTRLDLSELLSNFLLLLLDRQRLAVLGPILESYRLLADEHEGIVRTTLTSAQPLGAAQVEALRGGLEAVTGKSVRLTVATDPSLIAGVVARIGDKVLDGSIKAQLAKIHDTLQKG